MMKRKILCILLVCCLLLFTGCRKSVPSKDNLPATAPSITAVKPTAGMTETTTTATEPDEAQATEAATTSTEPQATESSKAPVQPIEPNKPEPPIPKPTGPVPTEPTFTETVPPEPSIEETVPPSTEPEQTQPTETEPVPTEPVPTEPAECQHDWVCIPHAEVGHWKAGIMCDCGWVVYGDPDELIALWNTHSASYPPVESLFEHGGFGSVSEWIVDTPAFNEWVCRKCGQQKE